jgi:uncharacterized protein (DUF1778 family)
MTMPLVGDAVVCYCHTMAASSNPTTILSVRVSPGERALLEAAAEQSRTSLSDFMRRKSVEAAELEILNRSVVTIPAEDWEAFEAWINRPAEVLPALRERLRRKQTRE